MKPRKPTLASVQAKLARALIAYGIRTGQIVAPPRTEPTGPCFKTTPGPRQGVRYVSPYRHICRRKGA